MEMHQLAYFESVSRHLHFTRAAEELNVAQPSVSQQIRKLEAELGTPLFHRMKRNVALTEAGVLFLKHARSVLQELDEARVEVQELTGLRKGTLAVGAPPSVGTHLFPRALAAFSQRHPGISLTFREAGSRTLVQLLEDGELDLAVVIQPIRHPALETRPLLEEELLLAVPHAHPLAPRRRDGQARDTNAGQARDTNVGQARDTNVGQARDTNAEQARDTNGGQARDTNAGQARDTNAGQAATAARSRVRLAQLRDEPFVLLREGAYDLRDQTLLACRRAGFEPRVALDGGEMDSVLRFVAAGIGIAILPAMVLANADGHEGSVAVRQLRPRLIRSLVLARRRDRYFSAAAQEFTRMLNEAAQPGAELPMDALNQRMRSPRAS
jgi:DNA-binding transcriptional LysR family regulator